MLHIETQELRALTNIAQKTGLSEPQVDWHLGQWQLWAWRDLPDNMGRRRALYMSSSNLDIFVNELISMVENHRGLK